MSECVFFAWRYPKECLLLQEKLLDGNLVLLGKFSEELLVGEVAPYDQRSQRPVEGNPASFHILLLG